MKKLTEEELQKEFEVLYQETREKIKDVAFTGFGVAKKICFEFFKIVRENERKSKSGN